MATIRITLPQLVVSGAVLLALASLGHGALQSLSRGARLRQCQAAAEGIRRYALAELVDTAEVSELPLNPATLPDSGSAPLDAGMAGWGGLAHAWRGEIPGQIAIASTDSGFQVLARCVPLPGEAPVLLVGDEALAMHMGGAVEASVGGRLAQR